MEIPVRFGHWFEMTPQRRLLVSSGLAALGIVGSLVFWQYRVMRGLHERAKAAGLIVDEDEARKSQAEKNSRFLRQFAPIHELGALERALDKGEEFAKTAEVSYTQSDTSNTENRRKMERAVDEIMLSLQKQNTSLENMLAGEALAVDYDRVKALHARCSALIERLKKVRDTNENEAAAKD
jgi:hypothetical protein